MKTYVCFALSAAFTIVPCVPLCFPIPEVINGDVTATGVFTGATLTLTCPTGYQLNGNDVATCLSDDTWSPALGTCVTDASACPVPPNVPNGDVTYTTRSVGDKANITCRNGYGIDGASTITCQTNFIWTTPGLCDPDDCLVTPSLVHGTYVLVNGTTTYGSIANVSCDVGFISTVSTVACLASADWEETNCTAKDCGPLPFILNGEYVLDSQNNNTTFWSTANVTCHIGYNARAISILCYSSGIWETAECVINGRVQYQFQ